MSLRITPITHAAANEFVRLFHRHHKPTTGTILCAAVEDDGRMCGVAIAGRPVAPSLQDGRTLEINRVCTGGTRNACSMLYGAIRRAARALGYERIITYTLPEEGGASLRAAGFRLDKPDMRIYAMQAKNKSLEIDAAEIRIRAERRLGELIAEKKADRAAFISAARASFSPGPRQPCEVCGKHAGLAHAHHVVPLEVQAYAGAVEPNQTFAWLYPTHHAAVHVAMSIDATGAGFYRLIDLTKDERRAVFAIADAAKEVA